MSAFKVITANALYKLLTYLLTYLLTTLLIYSQLRIRVWMYVPGTRAVPVSEISSE